MGISPEFAVQLSREKLGTPAQNLPSRLQHTSRAGKVIKGICSVKGKKLNKHFAVVSELLSQLSSVRSRAAAQSVSSQLQQLEMQLQSTRYGGHPSAG